LIRFHKIIGKPGDATPGHDHIWFSDSGTVYVADNEGHPIRMSTGSIEGNSIPVGRPPAANLIYHCKSNDKHYISTDTQWLELNSKVQAGMPGSGGGASVASAVTIVDSGDYYTSTDVESALAEIAQRLPSATLEILTNTVGFTKTSQAELDGSTANKPSSAKGWLVQGQLSTGETLGLSVGTDGNVYTRVNNSWKKLALASDLASIQTGTDPTLRVVAGAGLTGGGFLINNPTLALDPNYISNIVQNQPMPFLRTSGGYVTGAVELRGQNSVLDLTGVASGSNQIAKVLRLFNNGDSGRAGFRAGAGAAMFEFDMNNGNTYLTTRKEGTGTTISGAVAVNDIGQSGQAVFTVTGPTSKKIVKFASNKGFLQTDSSDSYNYIESGDNAGKPKDIKLSGPNNTQVEEVRFLANVAYSAGRFMSADGVTVGKHLDGYGTVNHSNKLYLYPYKLDPSLAYNNARRWYTHLGYNQDSRTLEIRTFVKDNSIHYSNYIQKDINVSATKFVSRSSEQYKNVHGKFTDKYDPLELLRNVDAWLYDFKQDDKHKQNAGFIIERGVPKFAVENEGTTIDSYSMVAALWEAVKELDKQVQELRNKVIG